MILQFEGRCLKWYNSIGWCVVVLVPINSHWRLSVLSLWCLICTMWSYVVMLVTVNGSCRVASPWRYFVENRRISPSGHVFIVPCDARNSLARIKRSRCSRDVSWILSGMRLLYPGELPHYSGETHELRSDNQQWSYSTLYSWSPFTHH